MNPAALATFLHAGHTATLAMFNDRPRRKRTQKRRDELEKFAREIRMREARR